MELTNELKVERIRLQLTAKSVAEMMGISRQQLSNIEQSDNLPVMVKYWKSHATLTPLAKQDCPPLATI